MVQNNHLTECRFMQTVRLQHIIDADELKAQFCEFDLLLQEFLFSDAGYLGIDRTFNDLLFDLRYFGRKKGARISIIS